MKIPLTFFVMVALWASARAQDPLEFRLGGLKLGMGRDEVMAIDPQPKLMRVSLTNGVETAKWSNRATMPSEIELTFLDDVLVEIQGTYWKKEIEAIGGPDALLEMLTERLGQKPTINQAPRRDGISMVLISVGWEMPKISRSFIFGVTSLQGQMAAGITASDTSATETMKKRLKRNVDAGF